MAKTSNTAGIRNGDSIPPYDEALERGLLGCMMQSTDAITEAEETFKPGASGLYLVEHQRVYRAIIELRSESAPIDALTIRSWLVTHYPKDKTEMERLLSLPEATPSAAHLAYYAEGCTRYHCLRRLIATCADLTARAYDKLTDDGELLDEAERNILDIRGSLEQSRGIADLMKIHNNLIAKYEAAFNGQNPGLLTGFMDLDNMTGGMQDQDMIILAGQQSTGKTSLAMNIAWNVAERGLPVGIISLETSAEKLQHRLYSSVGKLEGGKFLRSSGLTERDLQQMSVASSIVLKHRDKLLIDDSGGLTATQMLAKARRLRQRGASLIIIDYMQLLSAASNATDTERVTEISRSIKACAKENNCPILAISSLSRDAAKGERKPKVSDLRGSGQIDFDGNQIWLLSSEPTNETWRDVKLHVAKNKDGATGEIGLTFLPAQFRFESQAKINSRDVPEGTRYSHGSE